MTIAIVLCSVLGYLIIGYLSALVIKHKDIIKYNSKTDHEFDDTWFDFWMIFLLWGSFVSIALIAGPFILLGMALKGTSIKLITISAKHTGKLAKKL